MKSILFPSLFLLNVVCFQSTFGQIILASSIDGEVIDSGGWGVGGPSTQKSADSFTSNSTAYLSSIELTLGYVWNPGLVSVSLLSDDSGSVGSIIETSTVEVLSYFAETDEVYNAVFSDTTLLNAGTKYWIGLLPNDAAGYFVWRGSSSVTSGMHLGGTTLDLEDGEWNSAARNVGGYRVIGTAVPEPSTYGIVGIGILGSLILFRKMKKQ